MLTTTRYRFWSYDVWGNENDGFEVNDVYSSMAVVNIDERISDEDICEIVKSWYGEKVVMDQGSDVDVMYFSSEANGQPICELRVDREHSGRID